LSSPKKKYLQVLAYGQSEYVRKFGLTVNKEAVSTQARVLTAPTLKYGAGSKAATVVSCLIILESLEWASC
jgi:eukaryotic translation initiation factor 2C